jgi:hypothetical protein
MNRTPVGNAKLPYVFKQVRPEAVLRANNQVDQNWSEITRCEGGLKCLKRRS